MTSVHEQLADVADATGLRKLTGGYQSHVFEATRQLDGERVILKVLDASMNDEAHVVARVGAIAELAGLDRRVCRPLPLNGRLVNTVQFSLAETAFLVCYEDEAMRVFDLDDCGSGTTTFDVANSLYMVVFDAITAGRPEVIAPSRRRSRPAITAPLGSPWTAPRSPGSSTFASRRCRVGSTTCHWPRSASEQQAPTGRPPFGPSCATTDPAVRDVAAQALRHPFEAQKRCTVRQ